MISQSEDRKTKTEGKLLIFTIAIFRFVIEESQLTNDKSKNDKRKMNDLCFFLFHFRREY
jgi:hypothetical protein